MRPTRALLLATAALVALPAHAQTGENPFQLLGRLILGAGSAKVAIDTPLAVTAVEDEDLERQQVRTVGDVFKQVPGVQSAGASARPLGQAFNIRGIGNSEQVASESRIIVTVDGAPKFFEQYRMGSFFGDLDLYKRVEVLRGPAAGTLYGSGAIGGVIAFTTRDPGDFLTDGRDRFLKTTLGYDSNGNGLRGGLIFAQRAGENLELLGALNYGVGQADMVDGTGAPIIGTQYRRWSGLAKARLSFGEGDQSLTLSLSRTDSDLDATPVAQTGGSAIASFGTHDLRSIDDTASLTYRHEFAGNPLLDVTAQLSYTDTTAQKRNFSAAAMCRPGLTQVLCDSDFGYKTLTFKLENRADLSAGAWQNTLITGVQVSHQDRSASSSAGPLAFHPTGTDAKIGLYAQGEFVWNDRLTIVPGVRADFANLTPGPDAVALGGRAIDGVAVSPKLALHYKVNDSWAVFGSVAQTQRMPTLDELYSTQPASAPPGGGPVLPARTASLNLQKESALSYELGFALNRADVLTQNDKLQVKVTGFYNDVTNLIATTPRVPGGPAVPYFSNINAARIYGAELEGSYDADRWFAQAAWSRVITEDRATGAMLPDTPAENVSLTLGYKVPQHNLTLSLRNTWHGDITTPSAATSGPGYALHDVFVTWKPDDGALAGFNVNFGVENIFDRAYRNNLSPVGENGPGRQIKLTLSRTF